MPETPPKNPRIRAMELPNGGFFVVIDRLGRDPEAFRQYESASDGLAEKLGAKVVLRFSDEVDLGW